MQTQYISANSKNKFLCQYRFPRKNPVLLEKWEHAVRRTNEEGNAWKATELSHICSNHFQKWDYTLLPSHNSTCRLKNNAVPSVFLTCPSRVQSYNITEDARKRLEIPQKRSLFEDDEQLKFNVTITMQDVKTRKTHRKRILYQTDQHWS